MKAELILPSMDADSSLPMIAAMLCLVALSAFFSAAETAYSSLNQIRLKSRSEGGDRKAARVLALAQRYDSLLSTILIGNNIVNIALASLGTVFFTRAVSAQYGATIASVTITVLVLIFGEITPKSLAKEQPERVALAVAPVLEVLMVILTPLNKLFGAWKAFLSRRFHKGEQDDNITDAELMTMVSEAENDGGLTTRESELIRSAIEFDDVETEEVLTPRVDVVAVSDDISMEEAANVFAESGYSRLPVYHETIDNIIGVVHEKDFYAAQRKKNTQLKELITPALFTTATTKISALLLTLREQHHHLAIVLDEYGGTSGIVTLEDILEELVGEIWDEHDEETEEFRRQQNGSWLISGSASVDDLRERLGIPADESVTSVTVSGLIQEYTGKLPKVGDRFTIDNFEGVVTKAAHHRVLEVIMRESAPVTQEKQSTDEKAAN